MSGKEFDEWLLRHRAHLRHYEGWEVARLALSCGFTMAEVAPDVSAWITVSQRRRRLWENPLFEQWVSLWGYDNGHEWDM